MKQVDKVQISIVKRSRSWRFVLILGFLCLYRWWRGYAFGGKVVIRTYIIIIIIIIISPVSFDRNLPHDDDGDKELHKFAYWRMKKSSFARFARAFFFYSWTFRSLSRPIHDVKLPFFEFCGRREHMMTNFFSNLITGYLEYSLRA